jgi:D-galactarolactone cycloisomerase
MEIAAIRSRILRYNYPEDSGIRAANQTLSYREIVLVEVEGMNGEVGLGEAITIGGPPSSTHTIIMEELAPRLIGRDVFDRQKLWEEMYYGSFQHGRKGLIVVALSALDTALWDLSARTLGIPLYKLLGGYRDKVPAYASAGFYGENKGLHELAEEMREYAEKGFKAVKMKIGDVSLKEDIERVQAVRQAVGSNILVMVDANRSYNHWEAIQIGRELEKVNVRFFEEPLPADDLDGYRRLGHLLDIPLAAGENEYTLFGFRDLIDTGGVSVAQPDVSWSGGITACLKIASLCEARHVDVAPHSFTSIVNLATTLHLLGSIPNGIWIEVDQNPNGLRTDLCEFDFELDDEGCLTIPATPGIGIELDQKALTKYSIHESSTGS